MVAAKTTRGKVKQPDEMAPVANAGSSRYLARPHTTRHIPTKAAGGRRYSEGMLPCVGCGGAAHCCGAWIVAIGTACMQSVVAGALETCNVPRDDGRDKLALALLLALSSQHAGEQVMRVAVGWVIWWRVAGAAGNPAARPMTCHRRLSV